MSLLYSLAYRLGFKPWEDAATHGPARVGVEAAFDREEAQRERPYGHALDLGCGTGIWSVELARRGWQVEGIDLVPRAIKAARARASQAGVSVRFIEGDVTRLRHAGLKPPFDFVWDFGTLHGLTQSQRVATGHELDSLVAPDATMVILAWMPGWRGPLPRGVSQAALEAAFPSWQLDDVMPFDATGLPGPLRSVEPRTYRFRRCADRPASR